MWLKSDYSLEHNYLHLGSNNEIKTQFSSQEMNQFNFKRICVNDYI